MKQNIRSDLQEALKVCRGAFISAAGFSMVINFLMITPSIYMMQLYDRVVPTNSLATLWMLSLIMIGAFATLGALEWVRSQILVRVSVRLETLLNKRLFQVAFKYSLYSGGQRASSQPLDDLTGLRQFLTGNGLFAFFDTPWMSIYIILLFLFHPWYGWFALIVGGILTVIAIITEKATSKILSEANGIAITNRSLVNKNLRNAEVIESMGMLDNIRQRWLKEAVKVLDLQALASSRAGLLSGLSKLIRLSSQSLILALGAYLVMEHEISPGIMMAGSILLGRALAPIDLMIGSWRGFITAREQYNRLNESLLQIPADQERMLLPNPEGKLQLEAITVIPPGAKVAVLKDISLAIEKGDIVGVVGPSGSGKSTLVRAILGIWSCTNGNVRLDGADISNWDRARLGQFIGYLPQDIELFDGTISENISRFGEVDPVKVVEAAKMADVHELILRLPDGYDTFIGGNAGFLSGGQRQRVGLARALYGNPILVVLDEPNSNLDEQGERALESALQKLRQQKSTVIIVTHRNNVLAKVNKLLMLQEGQLALYGPREKVIEHLQKQQQAQQPKAQTPAPATPTVIQAQ
jgi:ATP-binding cassette subfamily C protein EexD